MQYLECSGMPVLYIGRKVLKRKTEGVVILLERSN
jgi:hypothetical protein